MCIIYESNVEVADGDFSVSFGDISLTYSSVDGESNLITFSIDGDTFQAEKDMTWAEWVESDYNLPGYYLLSNTVCSPLSNIVITDVSTGDSEASSNIESGGEYIYEHGVYCPM